MINLEKLEELKKLAEDQVDKWHELNEEESIVEDSSLLYWLGIDDAISVIEGDMDIDKLERRL